nr:uncharacterized protein LOC113811825 [Penaeus vannamei]
MRNRLAPEDIANPDLPSDEPARQASVASIVSSEIEFCLALGRSPIDSWAASIISPLKVSHRTCPNETPQADHWTAGEFWSVPGAWDRHRETIHSLTKLKKQQTMNPMRYASVLALLCVTSAAKLEGYSAGGDTGLGVTLDGVHGGAGHRGVGGGRVVPAIFVGSGVIPESAFGGVIGGEYSAPSAVVAPVATGGSFGNTVGGVISGEYSAPSAVVAPVATGGSDAGVAGGFGSGAVAEEYIPPVAGPDVTSMDAPPAPNTAYITPRN